MKYLLPVYPFLLSISVYAHNWASPANDTSRLSYNYSEIAPHPRLLLKAGEEKDIKAAVKRYPELKKMDDYIHDLSDKFLEDTPLVYKKEGRRLLAVSRSALQKLFYLSYSYRMTLDTRYLHKAEQELNAVCAFENWNPSHFLDVGEMCMAVAIAYDWLYNDLTENTKTVVRKALVEKAFAASDNKSDAWFLEAHNNWNSVCNAGLVYGALALLDTEKDKSIAIIERSLKSNILALGTFAPDGNYPEGPGYWDYGTSFEVMLIAALKSALGSDNLLSQYPGFLHTAYYMLFSQGPSGFFFNYSDCPQKVEFSPAMFWFANELKDPSLVYNETALLEGNKDVNKIFDNNRILPLGLIFSKRADGAALKKPSIQFFAGKGITPVCMVRTSWEGTHGKYLGIKGGSASNSHGHMDQGTFVYDAEGLRWASDFGLQGYFTLESKGVDIWNMRQNSQRWDVFRYNNLNHNTLTINNQRHKVEGMAQIVETYEKNDELGAKIDLTPVLNLNNDLQLATRKAVILRNDYLKIEDSISTNSKPVHVRWNMVTPAVAEIVNKNTIRLTQKGHVMLLKFDTDIPIEVVIRPCENPVEYKCEFGDYNYGNYNAKNRGSVMVGFDAEIPANKATRVITTIK